MKFDGGTVRPRRCIAPRRTLAELADAAPGASASTIKRQSAEIVVRVIFVSSPPKSHYSPAECVRSRCMPSLKAAARIPVGMAMRPIPATAVTAAKIRPSTVRG